MLSCPSGASSQGRQRVRAQGPEVEARCMPQVLAQGRVK